MENSWSNTGYFFTCVCCREIFHIDRDRLPPAEYHRPILCNMCENYEIIKSLQKQFLKLEDQLNILQNPFVNNAIINELATRMVRMRNLIVYNLGESEGENEKYRQQDDMFRIMREISAFCCIDMAGIQVYRIDADIKNVPRPLKVILKTEDDVHTVMRNGHRCHSGLRFDYDKTVLQRCMVGDIFDNLHFFRCHEEIPASVPEVPDDNLAPFQADALNLHLDGLTINEDKLAE